MVQCKELSCTTAKAICGSVDACQTVISAWLTKKAKQGVLKVGVLAKAFIKLKILLTYAACATICSNFAGLATRRALLTHGQTNIEISL